MQLTQAQIEQQNKLLRSLKIAQFINCPDCEDGWVVRGGYVNSCDTCLGSGRIYFDSKTWDVRLREWWHKLPAYKRANYISMLTFAGTLLAVLLIMRACGQ